MYQLSENGGSISFALINFHTCFFGKKFKKIIIQKFLKVEEVFKLWVCLSSSLLHFFCFSSQKLKATMNLWNHEPFYDSDDEEGVYADEGNIKRIEVLYYT